jgi:hypothetical protein
MGVGNPLDLAIIFVIHPFIRIVLAKIDFIALNEIISDMLKNPPFFGGRQGIWR